MDWNRYKLRLWTIFFLQTIYPKNWSWSGRFRLDIGAISLKSIHSFISWQSAFLDPWHQLLFLEWFYLILLFFSFKLYDSTIQFLYYGEAMTSSFYKLGFLVFWSFLCYKSRYIQPFLLQLCFLVTLTPTEFHIVLKVLNNSKNTKNDLY